MSITLPRIERKPSLNTLYGLQYRPVMVRKEIYDQLLCLKERSGLPLTELAKRAIEYFVKHAEVSDGQLSQRS